MDEACLVLKGIVLTVSLPYIGTTDSVGAESANRVSVASEAPPQRLSALAIDDGKLTSVPESRTGTE